LCTWFVKFGFMARDIGRMRFAIPSYSSRPVRNDVYDMVGKNFVIFIDIIDS